MTGKGFELFESKWTDVVKGEKEDVGFDPISLLLLLIPLLQQCLKPTPKTLLRRFLNRVQVACAIRQRFGMTWVKSLAVANKLFDMADKSTTEELQLFIDDCCDQAT